MWVNLKNMHNPLIVALDVRTREKALSLVKGLKDHVSIFKVGPALFTRYGPEIVRDIQKCGCHVFLDLKLYDIPNTVVNAAKAIADLNVAMFTVHISGGREMLKTAVQSISELRTAKPKILGVTVLTSVAEASTDKVLELVNVAKECRLDGVVSSPLEIESIRKIAGEDFVIVTPGVRPKGAKAGDQKRIATPSEAVKKGANYIVVGRPIIENSDPKSVVEQILGEIR